MRDCSAWVQAVWALSLALKSERQQAKESRDSMPCHNFKISDRVVGCVCLCAHVCMCVRALVRVCVSVCVVYEFLQDSA